MEQANQEHIFTSSYQTTIPVSNLTLPEFVLQDSELYANHVAFVDVANGKSYTHGDVLRETKRFAKALKSVGLRKGQVVVVVLPNVPEYAIVALGIMEAGGVFSGANPSAHEIEIKNQVEVADSKLIVSDAAHHEKVKGLNIPVIILGEERVENTIYWEELLEAADRTGSACLSNQELVNQNDLCALPFSSGTTGMAKGVMLTHRNLVANLCSTLFGIDQEFIGKMTILGLMPFFHIYGLTGICCATIRNKGKVAVMGRYKTDTFLKCLVEHEVSFAPVVPAIVSDMAKNQVFENELGKVKHLRSIMTAAAPLAPEVLAAFKRRFPLVEVQEAYGMTEHSCITLTHGINGIAKKGSVGFILPNLQVKFVDPTTGNSLAKNTHGELCVRSQCVMQGYYRNEEATAETIDENGWLHTGDIGYIDDDGNVFIVDRIKELIKYKGFQVAPAHLEAVLLTHPAIDDAAVVPLPDEEAGEIPAACVVVNSDVKETLREEDVIDYVASRVSTYEKVKVVHFVDNIPRSASGKILRRILKDDMLTKIHRILNEN